MFGDPQRVPAPSREGLRRAKPGYAHANRLRLRRGIERQTHPEQGAAQLGGGHGLDRAAVGLDEAPRGRQPEAGAVGLGGEERLEQVRARLGGQPRPVVGHLEDRLARRHPDGDGHVLARLDGVLDQVHEHALDLVGVAARGQRGGRADANGGAPLGGEIGEQLAGARRDRGEVGGRPLDARRAREREQRVDHVAQPRDLPHHLGAQARDPGFVGGILGDQLDGHAQAVERVLELVGDRRRGLAHGREALGVDERGLRGLELPGAVTHPLLEQGRPLAQLLVALPDRGLHALERPEQRRDLLGAGPHRSLGGRHPLPARDPARPGRQRLQRTREIGGQQDARQRGDHDPEQQDADERRPLPLEVRGQRPPRPGEHHRVGGRRPHRRVGEQRLLPVRLGGEGPGLAARRGGDRLRPARALGGARAIDGVDHLAGLVDQHGVGVAREVLVQRRRDEVVLPEGDHPHQRPGEASPPA